MKLSKKAIAGLCVCALAVTSLVGAIAFYVGSADPVENSFTIVAGGNDDIGKIEEPNWDPEADEDDDGVPDVNELEPGDTVAKDPYLSYTGKYDAWVFMTVEIPTIEAKMEGDEAAKVYDAVTIDEPLGNGWSLIKSAVSDSAGTNSVYYYAYDTVVSQNERTSSLFSSFTVGDFAEIDSDFSSSIDVSTTVYQAKTETHGGYTQTEAQNAFLGIEP